MTNVTLKVNERALVRHLKLGFTSHTTVLGELRQNARRAKASLVVFDYDEATGQLTVTDDGCGIADLQVLLTVAESGWDAETVAQEHPFGLGFLSAVYAAERLTVGSRGRRLSFATADLLAFRALEVLAGDTTRGTRLVLEGLRIPYLEAALCHRARGFPIEVRYNGEPLPRPNALDSGRHFDPTAVGRIHLYGLQPDEDWQVMRSDELICYLPGLPVFQSARYDAAQATVVHLDSARFRARLPDRDKLIDETEVLQAVRAEVRALAHTRLRRLQAQLSPEAFVGGYPCLKHWGLVALLNEVPFVPREILARIAGYPTLPRWEDDGIEHIEAPLPRSAVEGGEVRLAQLEARLQEEPGSLVRWLFAWRAGYTLIEAERLDPGHWVHRYVTDLANAPLDVELVGLRKTVPFESGGWLWNRTVRFCEAYRVTMAEETVEVTDAGLYYLLGSEIGEEGEFLIPRGETSGRVVYQAEDFLDEYDQYQERDAEDEATLMETFIIAHTSDTPAGMLVVVLRNAGLRHYPGLVGHRFVVHIEEAGGLTVEAAL